MSTPALLVVPFLFVELVVLTWALATGRMARIWDALVSMLRAPFRKPVAAPVKPRLELKAPNPAPGQCPVCSLEDLDERAADDDLLGDAGTVLARVVPYGPDRAHAECAAVVPYVAPQEHHHVGFYAPGGVWTYCGCERMREPPVVNNTLRGSVEAPPEWAALGVDTFAAAQLWRKHGFAPERAKAWIQNGFCDPQSIVTTGFRWPNELRAANGWLPFELGPHDARED